MILIGSATRAVLAGVLVAGAASAGPLHAQVEPKTLKLDGPTATGALRCAADESVQFALIALDANLNSTSLTQYAPQARSTNEGIVVARVGNEVGSLVNVLCVADGEAWITVEAAGLRADVPVLVGAARRKASPKGPHPELAAAVGSRESVAQSSSASTASNPAQLPITVRPAESNPAQLPITVRPAESSPAQLPITVRPTEGAAGANVGTGAVSTASPQRQRATTSTNVQSGALTGEAPSTSQILGGSGQIVCADAPAASTTTSTQIGTAAGAPVVHSSTTPFDSSAIKFYARIAGANFVAKPLSVPAPDGSATWWGVQIDLLQNINGTLTSIKGNALAMTMPPGFQVYWQSSNPACLAFGSASALAGDYTATDIDGLISAKDLGACKSVTLSAVIRQPTNSSGMPGCSLPLHKSYSKELRLRP